MITVQGAVHGIRSQSPTQVQFHRMAGPNQSPFYWTITVQGAVHGVRSQSPTQIQFHQMTMTGSKNNSSRSSSWSKVVKSKMPTSWNEIPFKSTMETLIDNVCNHFITADRYKEFCVILIRLLHFIINHQFNILCYTKC
jgi:hypothetical protein